MKKLLTLVLGCLLFFTACAPNPQATQSPSASESAAAENSQAPTQSATDAPTEAPTPSASATAKPEENVAIIEHFENGEISELITSTDWSKTQYSITNPKLMLTDDGTDTGKGLHVTLPDSSAWCQSFTLNGEKVTNAFKQGEKYLRIWVNNTTDGTLGIGVSIYSGNKAAYFDPEKAVFTGADGKVLAKEHGDPSGMGQGVNSAVIVPSGFMGWIAYDTSALKQRWNETLVSDLSAITKMMIDVRPAAYSEGNSYVLDGIVVAKSSCGTVREWNNPNKDENIELTKQEQILNGLTTAMNTTPEIHEMADFQPTGTYKNIKAIWYEGMQKNGKKTKVFAYIGFPAGASADSPVPAVVLIHGGGGHAFLPWVKMWNDRGYAAIAMDNTGYFPTAVNAGNSETCTNWRYGIPRDMRQDGYTNAPNNDDLNSSGGKVENMWMYHAVGQTILASNILRADNRVDKDKIGVTGISWGGLITSITMGYDDRFGFAVPVYCTGYSKEIIWGGMYTRFTRNNGTQELWAPENRYDKVTMPVMWLCWNDDNGLSVKSNSLSYLDGVKNNPDTRLSIKHKMYHSHSSAWNCAEIMAFADSVVKGGAKLTAIKDSSSGKSINMALTIDPAATKVTATAYYLTKEITHSKFKKYHYDPSHDFLDEHWNSATLTVNGDKVTGELPANALSYYVEIKTTIGGKQYVTSSTYTEVK